MQQDEGRVAALRDTPQCRYAVGIHFSVSDRLGLGGSQMQVLHDVPIRCQIQARLRHPFFDGGVELIHLLHLLASHSYSPFRRAFMMVVSAVAHSIRRSAPRRHAHDFRTGGCALSVLRSTIRMAQRDGDRRSLLIFWRARQELNARTSRRTFLEEVMTLK